MIRGAVVAIGCKVHFSDKWPRYNGLTVDEAFVQWRDHGAVVTDKEERHFWKTMFFARMYGSNTPISKLLGS